MTKNTYKIKEGQFFFHGPKTQDMLWSLIMLVISVLLFCFGNSGMGLWALVLFSGIYLFSFRKMRRNSVKVVFDPSCIYELSENNSQLNKLFGVSEGYHHTNSARFAWKCVGGKIIELWAYCYVEKERLEEIVITCLPGDNMSLEINLLKNGYEFLAVGANGERARVMMPRSGFNFWKLFTYKLFPYFGGSVPAPHDMEIILFEK